MITVLALVGCARNPEPMCTAYVKSSGATGPEYYTVKIREARSNNKGNIQLKTKYGWWSINQIDLKYGDCKFKLEQSGYRL